MLTTSKLSTLSKLIFHMQPLPFTIDIMRFIQYFHILHSPYYDYYLIYILVILAITACTIPFRICSFARYNRLVRLKVCQTTN